MKQGVGVRPVCNPARLATLRVRERWVGSPCPASDQYVVLAVRTFGRTFMNFSINFATSVASLETGILLGGLLQSMVLSCPGSQSLSRWQGIN